MTPADGGAAELAALRQAIVDRIARYPQDQSVILLAVAAGVASAMDRLNEKRARADQAMLAALVVASPGRVTGDLKGVLYERIATAIHEGNASAVEKRFCALAAAARQDPAK